MKHRAEPNPARELWWGLFLIAIGTVFMLDRYDVFHLPALWNLWPLALVIPGLIQIATPKQPKDIGSGVTLVLFGMWFFANMLDWWGMSYHSSWPLLLVIYGIGALIEAMLMRKRPESETSND
ncbi:MAG: hypothetical protein HOP12_15595 [Candidatus Eisenbacteria bacterium]|uniref:LiaF transmembrane domain-containing protein n=1 Tax=Eiseniibacteriota bacterium TaxID=2212470 RepID=A0A849SIH4_UNCEI|nr:hypothetical protein [Candidatus Eisenbacteria bacterium]